MNPHTEKALHNLAFLHHIETSFPTSYYDWKVTTLFYAALHLVHALADQKKIQIGQSHKEVLQNLNPEKGFRQTSTMPFSQTGYDMYYRLYDHSWNARYKPGNTQFLEKLNKANYEEAKAIFPKLVLYLVNTRGLLGVDHLVKVKPK